MADLISRAALLKDLSYCAPELWQDEEYIKAKIMKQPAVDAAPVVRCKDCICYDDEPGGTLKMCYCGLGWTSPDDYCSKGLRGKKMDGDTE